jgi:hypothetical protein
VIAALLIAALQGQGALEQADPKPAPWPREAHFEDRGFGLEQASSPASLLAVHRFGACIAKASAEKAGRTMSSDFRTAAYKRGVDQLVEANRECSETRNWSRMKTARLLLAGAIAENLIEHDPTPVNVQLARAALKAAPAAFSPSDGGAICTERTLPDDVGKLFATQPGSTQESEAAKPLQDVLVRCMGGQPVEINVAGLRAILSTAAYRSIHSEAGN